MLSDDHVHNLLEQVASGDVTVAEARTALEGVEIDEETYLAAVDHGVFNQAEPGTIVKASLAPSGASGLVILTFVWGMFWVVLWTGTATYGTFKGWDQQYVAYQFGMTLVTLIIMGIVYMRFVMPDLVIVKHRRNKYAPPKDPESWQEYKI
ncbi:MAG TPA: hypothetical protein QF646_06085 [Candidatus Poseidoniales archaeon]|nr:hypothetical protein [Candidatus Poseidoniales archaeon]